jgi:hypothetical protein
MSRLSSKVRRVSIRDSVHLSHQICLAPGNMLHSSHLISPQVELWAETAAILIGLLLDSYFAHFS